MTREHSTQSHENLTSPRLSPSQIPRPSEGQKSAISRSRAEFSRGQHSQSPGTECAPVSFPEPGPQATFESPQMQHQQRGTLKEVESPSTVDEGTESSMVGMASGDSSGADKDASAGGVLPPPQEPLPVDSDEHLRAVSCASTVFFDAPGTFTSLPDLSMSIEERPTAMIMPNLDGLIDNFTEHQCPPKTRPEPERTVSSNYSNSATLPSPVSPASPTTPRSPIIAPETLREELPSDVETMRRRLFSYSSDMFKSLTWERDSDLDLASLGRGGRAHTDAEARLRASSEESTVIEGDRSIHSASRVTSVNSGQDFTASGRVTGQAARGDGPVQWHDGPTDASGGASDAQEPGTQQSVTETCTITSTQAIKSRTFSSANDSESSGPRGSGEVSSRTGDESVSDGPRSSTVKELEKHAGAAHISTASVDGYTNNDEGEVGGTPVPNPGRLSRLRPLAAGAVLVVRKVLGFCIPTSLVMGVARLTGLKKTEEDGGEAESTGTRRRAFWKRRGSSRGFRKKRFWRVRMPWNWRRRDEAPLLAGRSTEG